MNEFLPIVIGAVMPVLISWLKSCAWPQKSKVLFTLAVCFVAGLLTVLASGEFSVENVAQSFGLVFTAATATYKLWFQDTEANRDLEEKQVF